MKKSWELKKIGDLCTLMTGGTPSKSKKEYFDGGKIKWLVSGDIHRQEITDCEGRITELGMKNSSAKFLPLNSVMIALNGQGKTRGTVALLQTNATCNQSLVSICPKDPAILLPEFLYMNLQGRYEEIRKITGDSGNERRGLNMPIIRSIKIPLPPVEEQIRIINYLKDALEKIERIQIKTEKNIVNVREVFESYRSELFTKNRKNWPQKKFKEVCSFVRGPFGGSLKKSCFVNRGIAVYEQQHAINDQFDQIRYFIDDKKFSEMRRFELLPGDLIMSCSGTMGKVALVPQTIKRGIINQALLKLSPNKETSPEFLKSWMESDDFQSQLQLYTKGAAIKNVASVKILKEIDIPLPKTKEQREVVEKLTSVYVEISRLEAVYKQKLKELAELRQSLLGKAFSGDLTANNVVTLSRLIVSQQAVETTSPEFAAHVLAFGHYWHEAQRRNNTYGHVKGQKFLHLAESEGKADMGRQPVKDAAGPNDFQHMLKAEEWAKSQQFFEFVPRQTGNGYDFKKLANYNAIIGSSLAAIKPYKDKLEKILSLLLPMNSQEAEVLATVHAAWNNLLLDTVAVTDSAIIHEARDNWHPSKMSIPETQFRKAIAIIRNNGIIPDGTAKRVTGQERLF